MELEPKPRAVHIDAHNVENSLRRRKQKLGIRVHAELLEEFASWLWSAGKSHETVYNYALRVFYFLEHLERQGKDVNHLALLELKKYVAKIKRKTTQHGVKIALKAFLRFLIEAYDELNLEIERDRLNEIYKYFKVENIKDTLPELPPNLPEIVEKLIDHARQPYKSILAIAYETGARRGEILNLKVGDVEDAGDYIKIKIRKSKSQGRTVVVIKYQNIVREWLKLHRFGDNPSAPPFLHPLLQAAEEQRLLHVSFEAKEEARHK